MHRIRRHAAGRFGRRRWSARVSDGTGEDGRPLQRALVACGPGGDWLREHGIRRVIVGHKPSGDSPAILSSRYTGVEVISGDTSYSDPSAADSRGAAVAGVILRGSSLDAMQVGSRPGWPSLGGASLKGGTGGATGRSRAPIALPT